MSGTTATLVVIEDATLASDPAAVPILGGETNYVLCRAREEEFSDFVGRLCARFVELDRKHTITHVSYLVGADDPEAARIRQYFLRYLLHTLDEGCELDLVTPRAGTADLLRALDELLPVAAPGVSLKARSAVRPRALATVQPATVRSSEPRATTAAQRSYNDLAAAPLAS